MWEHEFFPEVDKQGTVNVGEDVVGSAFAQDDLVDPGTLTAATKVVTAASVGPVEVQREFHGRQGESERQTGQHAGYMNRAATVAGDLPELDPRRESEVEPGCGHDAACSLKRG